MRYWERFVYGTGLLTSAQKVRWMNSLGISNAATSARLCAMSVSREPGSFSLNAFPVKASCLRIAKGFMLGVEGILDIDITYYAKEG